MSKEETVVQKVKRRLRKTEPKQKFYSTENINKKNATYNVIFGERSNGKTYALLKQSLEEYLETGNQMAYVRRWKEDITGRRAGQLYGGINESGMIAELTNGEFTGVHYWAGKWYLCTYDDNGKVKYSDQDIIAYAFALSDGEHDKSTSFPNITTIVFDEFLTSRTYLVNEFVFFMNTVSTIVRRRNNVRIYMLGNTVSKFCPYFGEMGLGNITSMEQGKIDVYRYGESPLTVAVEYCASHSGGVEVESNKYFAFNNPKLQMITGGAWELDIYPHLPHKYKPHNVVFKYFIDFNDNLFQCEVVDVNGVYFTYIHVKTTELKDTENDLIYSLDYDPRMNHNRSIFSPLNRLQERVLWFFKAGRVYYQSNDVGDTINNYLKVCRSGA